MFSCAAHVLRYAILRSQISRVFQPCSWTQKNNLDSIFHPCYTVNDNGNDNNRVFGTLSLLFTSFWLL
jgi:hypothetical protein